MNTKADIQDFYAQKTLAIVGLSRSGQSFCNNVYADLKAKGYRLFGINPNADTIAGEKCYPNLSALPEKVGGVAIFTPSTETEKVVREAAALGIQHIWIQQGAESEAAVRFCQENNLKAVTGQCIMMFAEPVAFFHKPHRWVWQLIGKIPA